MSLNLQYVDCRKEMYKMSLISIFNKVYAKLIKMKPLLVGILVI